MFFVLSKTLSFLTYPLFLSVLLLILFIFFRKRYPKVARIIFHIALIGLYIFSIAPIADLLLLPLEFPFEKQNPPEKVEAIVVLSGMVDLQRSHAGRIELSSSSERIIEGILLAKDYPDSLLILSGGSGNLFDQSKSEANLMKILALRFGISEDRIRLDIQSRNTYENAVESKKILVKENISSFVLVTSASHMKRALGCFRKVELNPIPYAVDFRNHLGQYGLFSFLPQARSLMQSTAAIHEYVGIITYKFRGYL
ncbi:TPA: YdcF family protein [Candidatus Poribacteria bacterium]|nr:YdcF family protein [Candidatus Poribacteria bacterium]